MAHTNQIAQAIGTLASKGAVASFENVFRMLRDKDPEFDMSALEYERVLNEELPKHYVVVDRNRAKTDTRYYRAKKEEAQTEGKVMVWAESWDHGWSWAT
ncbi:MAG TPA: hypothetical protein PKD24_05680 [Pyrinomonadaceae bacterium]|nr:hypothetical protein [Pyrinomonadaceae bacterium]HMP65041.1 hypothetical protein [Pyrinomonadaceae bacterium]